MAAHAIISYDGTPNDDDALALGKRLAAAGSGSRWPTCATPGSSTPGGRSSPGTMPSSGSPGAPAARGSPVARHVVVGASTGERLGPLPQRRGHR